MLKTLLAALLALLVHAQDTQPKKKKGFFDKLNEKLEKLNRTPEAPPPPPEPAPSRPAYRPPTKRMPGPGLRAETCTDFGWKANPAPDSSLVYPPGTSVVYTAPRPIQPEPDATFTLDQLGRTKSIRISFPPTPWKQVVSFNRERRILTPRDPSPPFEVVLTLENGTLFSGYCDQDGAWYGSSHEAKVAPAPMAKKKLYVTLEDQGIGGPVVPFRCQSCYFVDKVFHSGSETSRFVILVNPDAPADERYYRFRIRDYPRNPDPIATGSLCNSEQPSPCVDGPMTAIGREQADADITVYPGLRTTYWYLQCDARNCERRTFDSLLPQIQ